MPDTANLNDNSESLLSQTLNGDSNSDYLRQLLRTATATATTLKTSFVFSCVGILLLTTVAFGVLLLLTLQSLLSALPPLAFYSIVVMFAFLLGATVTHYCGNLLIAMISGFDDSMRRGLALHLPANSAPREWPRYFRRWLYCGDWLVESIDASEMPYVRAFITGAVPANLAEELVLWESLMQARNNRQTALLEIGHSIYELAVIPNLPVWAKNVTAGMSLREIEAALGDAGHQWAIRLLKRAARRKKKFGEINFSGNLNEAVFEFYYYQLSANREVLLTIIRPHLAEYEPLSASDNEAA